MSMRRSLLLFKHQPPRRFFCNRSAGQKEEYPFGEYPFDRFVLPVILGGAATGSVLGGVTTYKNLYNKDDYFDCVMHTTCGACMGMVSGFATIILLPIIVPVAITIAIAGGKLPPPK
jgi:hypothetical protein